jgi:hypothetical protein
MVKSKGTTTSVGKDKISFFIAAGLWTPRGYVGGGPTAKGAPSARIGQT